MQSSKKLDILSIHSRKELITNETYGQPISLLVESTPHGGDVVRFVVEGDMDADLDSSLSSLNPLSVPSVSLHNKNIISNLLMNGLY